MQQTTIHTRCAMQRTAFSGQQTTRNSQTCRIYIDNVEKTTDAMQRSRDNNATDNGRHETDDTQQAARKDSKQQETRSI
jgi:hypothetical protein